MNDAELKQQPRSVREEFDRISDGEISGDPEVAALVAELTEALSIAGIARERHDSMREIAEWIPSAISAAERAIAEIQRKREAVITAAMIAEREEDEGPNFGDDDQLLAELEATRLRLSRLQIASGGIERAEKATRRGLDVASSPCVGIEDKLSDARDRAKLALARQRQGF